MQRVIFLTNKQAKELFQQLDENWGCEAHELLTRFAVLKSTKDKIYLISKDVERVILDDKRLDSIGLYFADMRDNKLRLSMEGAQLIGPIATKNIIEITQEELRSWLKGEDLEKDLTNEITSDLTKAITKQKDIPEFVLLKYGRDFVGSGKYANGTIYNFVPKSRRTKELIVAT